LHVTHEDQSKRSRGAGDYINLTGVEQEATEDPRIGIPVEEGIPRNKTQTRTFSKREKEKICGSTIKKIESHFVQKSQGKTRSGEKEKKKGLKGNKNQHKQGPSLFPPAQGAVAKRRTSRKKLLKRCEGGKNRQVLGKGRNHRKKSSPS